MTGEDTTAGIRNEEPVVVSRRFRPRAPDVRAARRFAAAPALAWGVDPSALETVVGELAANAFAHARTAFTVTLRCPEESVLSIEVTDGSLAMPMHAHASPESLGGRGLVMVDALSVAWGARATAGGKVVWAELRPARLETRLKR